MPNKKNLKLQTLMNKEIEVLDFMYDIELHTIDSIVKLKNEKYAPLQILEGKVGISRYKLNKWWQNRGIPDSRENVKDKLLKLGIDSPTELLEKFYGLSLSDQYWVKDYESNVKWEDINFFENDFSEDVGNYFLGNNDVCNSFKSPDNSSDGMLLKKWKIIDGKRCLIKGGSSSFNQEPFNEVIATKLYERILDKDEFVKYSLYEENGKWYSLCDDMINTSLELVPAHTISEIIKKNNNISLYEHYINCLNTLNIKDAELKIDKMIVCDYILSNVDRHWNNFGVIRNVDTLNFVDVAPIFDNGLSLYAKTNTKDIKPYEYDLEKNNPFKNNFKKQLELVKDLSWFDVKKLDGFIHEVDNILSKKKYMDKKRIMAINNLIISNINDIILHKEKLEK